jgi:hypothetical protein
MMNGPMDRPVNAPVDWFCNVRSEHGKTEYLCNRKGRAEKVKGPCRCSACIREQCRGLREGEPVSGHPDWSQELLIEKGYVGLYRTNGAGDGVERVQD